MPCWNSFVEKARPLAAFLSHKPSLERYIHLCVRGSVHESQELLLRRPFASLYTGRWGSIAGVLTDLLDVQDILQQTWCQETFLNGRSAKGLDEPPCVEQSRRVILPLVTAAIKSPTFWAQAVMLHATQSVLERFSNWTEACPCHRNRSKANSWWQRSHASSTGKPCAMLGNRAPEMAAGDHQQVLAHAVAVDSAGLLRLLPPGLEAKDRDEVMTATPHFLSQIPITTLEIWGSSQTRTESEEVGAVKIHFVGGLYIFIYIYIHLGGVVFPGGALWQLLTPEPESPTGRWIRWTCVCPCHI